MKPPHIICTFGNNCVLFGTEWRCLSIYWTQMEADDNSLLSTQPELTNDHSPTSMGAEKRIGPLPHVLPIPITEIQRHHRFQRPNFLDSFFSISNSATTGPRGGGGGTVKIRIWQRQRTATIKIRFSSWHVTLIAGSGNTVPRLNIALTEQLTIKFGPTPPPRS